MVQGSMNVHVHQYAAKFVELSCFVSYLILDEKRKTQKFEECLNFKIYNKVISFQILNFTETVNKASIAVRSLQRSAIIYN